MREDQEIYYVYRWAFEIHTWHHACVENIHIVGEEQFCNGQVQTKRDYRTHMANLALKCQMTILIIARSLCSYNNILINFGQVYSNSCYTTFSIAALGMCIACEFQQLWAMRPWLYHIFRHLTKWLVFLPNWPCKNGIVPTHCHVMTYKGKLTYAYV